MSQRPAEPVAHFETSAADGQLTVLTADWIAPVCAPLLRDGWLAFRGREIVALGSGSPPKADERVDLGRAIITPGLVNPHTHLELSCYADQIPPTSFYDWLIELIRLRSGPDLEAREERGAVKGAWDSLRCGVTCVGDISRRNSSWRVLRDVPIRMVCFAELLSLADAPPRNPAELRDSIEAMQPGPLQRIGVTPHAAYSVFPDHFRDALALASPHDRPWTTHWCETLEEVAWLRGDESAMPAWCAEFLRSRGARPPGVEPAAHLGAITGPAGPGLLAHANYLSEADLVYLVEARHTVAYCPRAHRYFGHAPHPLPRLLAAGVPVVFGTDSRASNWSLSILEELRLVDGLPGWPGSPADLLKAATVGAAAALGWDDTIGMLAPGMSADVAAFALSGAGADPIAELIRSAPPALGVWVAGKKVVAPAR